MAFTIKFVLNAFNKAMTEYSDPRVEDWFLMKSIYPTLGIIGAYLYFVLKCGPHFMKDRKAFNVDQLIIWYNITQILASGYLFIMFCREVILKYNFWCEPLDYTSAHGLFIAKHVWYFYILKIIDLLDTVFFVLRKKQNHISFLHVYHHAGMVALIWFGTKFTPGGTVIYLGGYNCVVHVFMYTYYLLSIWNKKLVQNIWWKKCLTQIQLIQFGLNILQHLIVILHPSCGFPKIVSCTLVPQNLFMVALFGDFYYKTYIKVKEFETTDSRTNPSKNSALKNN